MLKPFLAISGGGRGKFGSGFRPKIFDLQILDTSSSSLTFSALVNISNPTEYSATVPYADIHMLNNGSIIGHATARDLYLKPGENNNLYVETVWDPLALGGKEAAARGRELLSQYISGYNTTLTLKTHKDSIPTQPMLGEALSKFELEMPTPKLFRNPRGDTPKDPSCLLYTSPSPRDGLLSRMPSSA